MSFFAHIPLFFLLISDVPGLNAFFKNLTVVIGLDDLLDRVVGKYGAYPVLGGLGPFLVVSSGICSMLRIWLTALRQRFLIFNRVANKSVTGASSVTSSLPRTRSMTIVPWPFSSLVGEVPVDKLPVVFFFKFESYHVSFSAYN